MPTALENYLFDLRGYLVLKNALSPQEVRELNEGLDAMPPLKPDEWHGHVHRENMPDHRGTSYQQIYEAGKPFEKLIDHPSWINHALEYVGGKGTFDQVSGPLCIDENFALLRGPGQAIGLHSGGHLFCKHTQFHFSNGAFSCGQINILMALTDIGPGDGGTMVIPGSHKSNLPNPAPEAKWGKEQVESMGSEAGAIEVHLKAGDALLFVDSLAHGSAERVNPGQRRVVIYRYSPSWTVSRFGYEPSSALLARLTLFQSKIVQPQAVRRPPQPREEYNRDAVMAL